MEINRVRGEKSNGATAVVNTKVSQREAERDGGGKTDGGGKMQ